MPELPEVETIVRGLVDTILAQPVQAIHLYFPSLIVFPDERNALVHVNPAQRLRDLLSGDCFVSIDRHGKYIKLTTQKGLRFLVHLRMTGQLFIAPEGCHPDKHVHLQLALANGTTLIYRDIRKFGRWVVIPEEKSFSDFIPAGPDALSISQQAVAGLIRHHPHRKLKSFLLDQKILAGIGNIYADEICFLLSADPECPAGKISPESLFQAIHHVLQQAIKNKGTSVSDYITSSSARGNFQNLLHVYKQKDCRKCGTEIVRKKVAGRTSHVCPRCQT